MYLPLVVRDNDGAIVRPLPRAKRMLSEATCLPHLVQVYRHDMFNTCSFNHLNLQHQNSAYCLSYIFCKFGCENLMLYLFWPLDLVPWFLGILHSILFPKKICNRKYGALEIFTKWTQRRKLKFRKYLPALMRFKLENYFSP